MTYTIKALAAQTNGTIGFIEASTPPGGGPGPHMHLHEEETLYMLSGELEFLDGDHTFTAKPGDFVHVPRGVRHRFLNKGVHTSKMISMSTRPVRRRLSPTWRDPPYRVICHPRRSRRIS